MVEWALAVFLSFYLLNNEKKERHDTSKANISIC